VNLDGSEGPSTISFGSAGDIILGPDDFIWVSRASKQLLRINPANGAIEEFDTDQQGGGDVDPRQMVLGPDDRIWFTYSGGSGGRGGVGAYDVDTDAFTYFHDSNSFTNNKGITFDPEGNVWYLDEEDDAAVRMTTSGVRTRFTASGWSLSGASHEITYGPGDDLWAGGTNDLARIDAEPIDPACLPPAFSDVSTSHTFFEDICWMDVEEISTGYPDGTYRPSAPVSRQAMSAFMYRLAGQPIFSPGSSTFTDVSATNTFFHEIEWMADTEISTGYLPGPTYRPSTAVSRQAMSAFMRRLAEGPGIPA
jgi:hypothetical protein